MARPFAAGLEVPDAAIRHVAGLILARKSGKPYDEVYVAERFQASLPSQLQNHVGR
jgi:hypothetical protein